MTVSPVTLSRKIRLARVAELTRVSVVTPLPFVMEPTAPRKKGRPDTSVVMEVIANRAG
jgi:hypothetical protein